MAEANVLFLDKEGGFGGSSRSLYFLIKHLDRGRILPVVALREPGPALEWYSKLGIRTFLFEDMPGYKPSPRNNLWVLLLFLLRIVSFWSSCRFLSCLARENKIDIIHMNHDSFFVYASFLKRFTGSKILIHMRTMLPANRYAALQAKWIEKRADHLVFISENEFKRYSELLGYRSAKGSVIFNTCEVSDTLSSLHGSKDHVFKVLYLGNLTYNKGADRLIDLALEIKSRGIKDILFVVCGEDRGKKGEEAEGTMTFRAERAGVKPYLRFMGHQEEPERFIREADALIRLSRWNDPWGRDIIEAMANGKPVLATGTYDRFVEHGVNGFLHSEYDPRKLVDDILRLSVDPDLCSRFGRANIAKAKELFDGPSNAAKVEDIYEALLTGARG